MVDAEEVDSLRPQAAAEEAHRREVAAAQERAASLEGRARQLQAELEAAEGRAGAGAAVEAELSAARADARGLRRRAEELEVRLGEKEAARVSLAEGLAAEGAARREAAAAAAAHVEVRRGNDTTPPPPHGDGCRHAVRGSTRIHLIVSLQWGAHATNI